MRRPTPSRAISVALLVLGLLGLLVKVATAQSSSVPAPLLRPVVYVVPIEGIIDLGLAPFVRSRLGQTTQDTGFGESLPAGTDARPAVLLHKLTGGDPMVGPAQYHTLILPLPKHSFRLRVVDMRLFVLPAALGAEPDLPRLGSFAL